MTRARLPLPESDCRLPMDGPPRYRADQMHAYADAETAALRTQASGQSLRVLEMTTEVAELTAERDALKSSLCVADANFAAVATKCGLLRDALQDASNRMGRARNILTDGKPTPVCNWGMLATESARAALEATK